MTEVVFITSDDARFGFSLAGTMQVTVAEEKAEEQLRQIMTDSDVGVIVIDERLVKAIDVKHYSALEKGWKGVMVTLPAPEREMVEEDYLHRLIKRALGYHVRLQI